MIIILMNEKALKYDEVFRIFIHNSQTLCIAKGGCFAINIQRRMLHGKH